jgi:RNA polymerase sigma-70 factor (ECF subfamily)
MMSTHSGWLRTVIRARVFDPSDVEDVLQNVACAVAGSTAIPIEQERIAPWLYRVAIRMVLQLRRKEGRHRRMISHWSADRPTQAIEGPVDQLMVMESRQAVRNALDRLGDVDRQVLLLKYTENWSYHDLADHLGVSTGAIEHRLIKARNRLREELRITYSSDAD